MESGNRQVLFAVFVLLAAAPDAGRVREASTETLVLVPERIRCVSELKFERIDVSAGTADYIAVGSGLVNFQWNAATSELSFSTDAVTSAVTLPENFVKVASTTATMACESR